MNYVLEGLFRHEVVFVLNHRGKGIFPPIWKKIDRNRLSASANINMGVGIAK